MHFPIFSVHPLNDTIVPKTLILSQSYAFDQIMGANDTFLSQQFDGRPNNESILTDPRTETRRCFISFFESWTNGENHSSSTSLTPDSLTRLSSHRHSTHLFAAWKSSGMMIDHLLWRTRSFSSFLCEHVKMMTANKRVRCYMCLVSKGVIQVPESETRITYLPVED